MLQLTVIGNIGNDAIIRDVNGKKTINFSLASNESWKDAQGAKHEKTTWINCTLWRDENIKIAEFLKKGTKVCVQGPFTSSLYKNTKNESAIDISVNVKLIELLDSKKEEKPVV